MKEAELQKLMKDSVKSPSDDFTDKIMNALEPQKKLTSKIQFKLVVLCFFCVLIFISSIFIEIPDISYKNISISISPVFVLILSTGFLLYEVKWIIEMRNKLHNEISPF